MAITNGYATLAEIRSFVAISDMVDDALLEQAVEAASRAIDGYTGRRFWQDASPVARLFTANSLSRLPVYAYVSPTAALVGDQGLFETDDIATTSGLVVQTDDDGSGAYATTWTINTDFVLEPVNAAADGEPWTGIRASGSRLFPTSIRAGVKVTARWGWPSVPMAVKYATLLQASRLFVRRQSPYGIAGSPDLGSEVRLLSRLDPDVEQELRPYRRVWGVV